MRNVKQFVIIISLLTAAMNTSAQIGNFKEIKVKDKIVLGDKNITQISNDTTFAAADSLSLPTSWAVKGYVNNKLGSLTIATGNTYVVNSQAAMLALSANVGDVAVRSDSALSFILQNLPASTLSNWVQLLFPVSIPSVFGRTGNITAQSGDYTHSQVSGVDSLFALKQTQLNGTGFVKASGTTITYDNTDYLAKSDSSLYSSVTRLKDTANALRASIVGNITTLQNAYDNSPNLGGQGKSIIGGVNLDIAVPTFQISSTLATVFSSQNNNKPPTGLQIKGWTSTGNSLTEIYSKTNSISVDTSATTFSNSGNNTNIIIKNIGTISSPLFGAGFVGDTLIKYPIINGTGSNNPDSLAGYKGLDYLRKDEATALYEPIISTKNTAFNKNFGTTAGTVSEGNHTHTFASLTSKPTTLSGYGITDAQSTIIGAATTITSSNLTTNRALISNGSGKVAVSSVTSTELGYVAGVTSSIQTQLNSKISGNQTITLSGDVSGSGTTAITTTIGAGKVTNAMLANSTISGISLGNNLNMLSAGTGLKFTTGTAYNGGVAREISADFGITAGKVVDGKQFIDSIAAIRALATGVYDTVYADSPLHVRDSSGKQTLFIDTASATKDGVLLAAKYTEFNNKVSSQWTTSGSDIYYNTGNVGIGVSTPAYKMDVDGDVNISAGNGIRLGGYKGFYALPALGSYFIGNNAGNNTMTNGYNIAIGASALNKATTAGYSVAVGHTALANATTGGNNTAIGNKGMYSTVGGAGNVSVGAEAMYTNTGGSYNTGVGYVSLQYNINGTNNTAVGFGSLRNVVNGYYNTAVGSNAGKGLFYGNNNIFIGNEAGNNASQEDTVTNTIVIGYNQYSTASNQLNIGGIINGNLTTGNIDLTGRIKKRIGSEASSATPTINAKNYDIYKITALTVNISNMSTNFTLPDFEGDEIEIWITGTASRTISWGSSFVASTVSLPTTTSGTNTLHCVFIREGATMTIKYVY